MTRPLSLSLTPLPPRPRIRIAGSSASAESTPSGRVGKVVSTRIPPTREFGSHIFPPESSSFRGARGVRQGTGSLRSSASGNAWPSEGRRERSGCLPRCPGQSGNAAWEPRGPVRNERSPGGHRGRMSDVSKLTFAPPPCDRSSGLLRIRENDPGRRAPAGRARPVQRPLPSP